MKRCRIAIISVLYVIIITSSAACVKNLNDSPDTDTSTNININDNLISNNPITLTYLVNEHPSSPIFTDALVFKELEKRTNIRLDFVTVPTEAYQDKFNVIVSSGKIPDLLTVNSDIATAYGSKGLFAKMNDLISSSTYLKEIIKPVEWLGLATEDGSIYSIPYIIDTSKGLAALLNNGWTVRKDWLDKLGMREPETLDEFYEMLVGFRDRIPVLTGKKTVYPLVQRYGLGGTIFEICNMFGTKRDYNIVDGKVVYTAVTKEYCEMLMFVNKLYANNLLDKEFLTLNTSQWEMKVTSGDAGCSWDNCGRADMFSNSLSKSDPEAELKLILPPKGPTGVGTYELSDATNYYSIGVAISSRSKYINEAFKLYDYIFSSEGSEIMNFGVEGVTYEVVNGEYRLTDKLKKEIETGLIPQLTLAKYGIGIWNLTYFYNVQGDILKGNIGPKCADLAERLKPEDICYPLPVGKFTAEQLARLKEIEPALNSLRDEYSAKFMVGTISFDMWDGYVSEMKKNNSEEYEKILNDGYMEYLSRLKK